MMGFDTKIFQSILVQGLAEWELGDLENHLSSFTNFAQAIIETNRTLNLTRIVESEEMAIKNILDSVGLLRLGWPQELRCLDLGTGAGFPGVPLAMCRPGWTVILLDSLRKRLRFLEDTSENLGLTNVMTLHSRAEDAGQDKQHRETYDLVVSRAVAHLPVLLERATPLVKVGGHFVAYKGGETALEIEASSRAMKQLRVSLEQVFPMDLPFAMGSRNLLVFKKEAPTPPPYPRKAGIPNKQPL